MNQLDNQSTWLIPQTNLYLIQQSIYIILQKQYKLIYFSIQTKILMDQANQNLLLSFNKPKKTSDQFYLPESVKKKDFTYIVGQETHSIRRQLILKSHPQIYQLMKINPYITVPLSILLVITQYTVLYFVKDANWMTFLLVAYFVGGTIAHTSHVLIHDLTHLVGHPNVLVNKLCAILINMNIGIPTAISFGKYHADHHNFLSQEGKDPDLPLKFEAAFVNSSFKKAIYLLLITFVYALRPLFSYAKPLTKFQVYNFFFIISTDYILLKYLGLNAILYIIICGYLSIGPHPAAFHILAEHFDYVPKLETYDYIGIMNILNLNMGYHIQHHDFPNIPWYNLRKVRKAAPEFYQYLPVHTSYFQIVKKLILDDNFGLYNRILRIPKKQ